MDEQVVAVGYPYYHVHQVAQPPPSPSHASTSGQRRRRTLIRCTKCFLCFIITVFTIFFFFLGVTLYFTSKLTAPKVRVDSIFVSPYNVSSDETNTNWDINLFLGNPNRHSSITYKITVVSVLDQEKRRLGMTVVDSHYQDEGKEGLMKARVSISSAKKMKLKNKMDVEGPTFSLKLEAMVLVKTKYLDEQWYLMEASCKGLKVRSRTHSSKRLLVTNGSSWCNANLK